MAEKPTATEFIDALHRAEDAGDIEPLVRLFGPESELTNPTLAHPHLGIEGARAFWDTYRRTFRDIHSEFRLVLESDRAVILEWTSRGTAPDGQPFAYEGVSIVELEGDTIRRFRAYFDPRALGAQLDHRTAKAA